MGALQQVSNQWIVVWLLATAFAVGCASPSAPVGSGAPTGAAAAAPRAEKRIVYATPFSIDIRPNVSVGPRQSILPLIASGLSSTDGQGGRAPILAESVPTLENGLWTVADDGTMVTTFHLHPGAQWHDGAPLTADDFIFTLQVGQEGHATALGDAAYAAIADIHASDPQTLVVNWKEPYSAADGLFSWTQSYGSPLPRHLLADAYASNPDGLLDLPYWTQDYVGSGPFKVVSWDPGVGMQLAAHDGYARGRPKIDRIEVQYIPDANTLIANLLTGRVDATPNLGSADAGKQLSDQWQGGEVLINFGAGTYVSIVPQFIDPTPAAITDLRFRTALAIGMDRQTIVDQIALGLSPVPLSFLSRGQPQYAALEATLPRYDYEPQRATQMLADLGYTKNRDRMLLDPAGQPLAVEVRSSAAGAPEQFARAAAAIGDDWQRLGVAATLSRVPPERGTDLEYIATFPGFYIVTRINDADGLAALTSSHTMLASNRYRAPSPQNYSRYLSAELDGLIARYFRTIPRDQRADLMRQIVRTTTDQLLVLPLWYSANSGARAERLTGVGPQWPNASFAWNAYAWDVQG